MALLRLKPDFIVPEGGLNEVSTLRLGGINQTILIQAENPKNPVLLFLHGGPSMPSPGISSRGRDYTVMTCTKELVQHYVLVFWDQRGSGKSYHSDIPEDSMNMDQFISDASELTDYLRGRFNQQKIFVAGHSWGTVIGLQLVSRHPEKYHHYFGISQIVNWSENDRLGMEWTKEQAIRRRNTSAIRELEAAGTPPFLQSVEQWGILRKWQAKFNSLYYTDKDIKHPGMWGVMKPFLLSGEYNLLELAKSFYKGYKLTYHQAFIEEIQLLDLKDTIRAVEIPVTFIHGARDVHVFGKLAEDLYRSLESATGKQFIWLEKSGHFYHPEEAKLIEQILISHKHS